MVIHEQQHGAVTVVRPTGPLVGDDAQSVKTRLAQALQQSMGRLVLDLSAVPFVDSRGLEALVEMTQELGQRGRSLKLYAVNETLREVFEITGCGFMFEHYQDVSSGVRSFL